MNKSKVVLPLLGRKMVTIIDPHIKRDGDYHIHSEAEQRQFYVKKKDGSDYEGWCWPGSSSWIDFLNPEARKWWADKFAFSEYKVYPSLAVRQCPSVRLSVRLSVCPSVRHKTSHRKIRMNFCPLFFHPHPFLVRDHSQSTTTKVVVALGVGNPSVSVPRDMARFPRLHESPDE